ncbi:MAG: hypothetical protein WCG06_05185, partial [Candidatus Omnitrophota bacterium]
MLICLFNSSLLKEDANNTGREDLRKALAVKASDGVIVLKEAPAAELATKTASESAYTYFRSKAQTTLDRAESLKWVPSSAPQSLIVEPGLPKTTAVVAVPVPESAEPSAVARPEVESDPVTELLSRSKFVLDGFSGSMIRAAAIVDFDEAARALGVAARDEIRVRRTQLLTRAVENFEAAVLAFKDKVHGFDGQGSITGYITSVMLFRQEATALLNCAHASDADLIARVRQRQDDLRSYRDRVAAKSRHAKRAAALQPASKPVEAPPVIAPSAGGEGAPQVPEPPPVTPPLAPIGSAGEPAESLSGAPPVIQPPAAPTITAPVNPAGCARYGCLLSIVAFAGIMAAAIVAVICSRTPAAAQSVSTAKDVLFYGGAGLLAGAAGWYAFFRGGDRLKSVLWSGTLVLMAGVTMFSVAHVIALFGFGITTLAVLAAPLLFVMGVVIFLLNKLYWQLGRERSASPDGGTGLFSESNFIGDVRVVANEAVGPITSIPVLLLAWAARNKEPIIERIFRQHGVELPDDRDERDEFLRRHCGYGRDDLSVSEWLLQYWKVDRLNKHLKENLNHNLRHPAHPVAPGATVFDRVGAGIKDRIDAWKRDKASGTGQALWHLVFGMGYEVMDSFAFGFVRRTAGYYLGGDSCRSYLPLAKAL